MGCSGAKKKSRTVRRWEREKKEKERQSIKGNVSFSRSVGVEVQEVEPTYTAGICTRIGQRFRNPREPAET